ncbi:MAG: response regulator [Bacteroidia bacterium]
MTKVKVIIADDHPIFRIGLKNIIEANDLIEICSECDNGNDAYNSILTNKPDVAVLDIEMPGMNGLQVCEKVLSEKLPTKILLLTLFKETSLYKKAVEIGASGYLLKDNAPNDLIKAILALSEGKTFFTKELEDKLIEGKSHFIEDPIIAETLDKLSNTELKVLKLVSQQMTTKDIAGKLFISEKTVENHRYNISKKLNLPSGQNSLLKFALEHKDRFK